jgi:hypothetical protein
MVCILGDEYSYFSAEKLLSHGGQVALSLPTRLSEVGLVGSEKKLPTLHFLLDRHRLNLKMPIQYCLIRSKQYDYHKYL